jgi:hypothetical protein
MKNLIISLFSLLLIGFAGTALAKQDKSTVLHCGCAWDDIGEVASMVYSEINISSKSRGHDAHVFATLDSCYDGQDLSGEFPVDDYTDFVRTAADCQLDGPELGDPIDWCTTQEEADDALILEPPQVLYVPVAGDECGTDEAP